jgi:hypothetical protein
MAVVTVEDRVWQEKLVALEEVPVILLLLVLEILLQPLQAKVLEVVLVAHQAEVQLTLIVLVVVAVVVHRVPLARPVQMSQEVAMVVTEQHQVFLEHQ